MQDRLLRWYSEVQVPRVCWSDNGGQFKSVICEAFKKTLDISPHFIPPRHPQSNGLVEAFLACTFFRVNFPGSEFLPVAFRSSCCRPLLIALLGGPTICRAHIYRIFSPRFNKVVEFSSGGQRDRLMHTVSSYNNLPRRPLGVSPETVWRACRPLDTHGNHPALKHALQEQRGQVTEAEWTSFLTASAALTFDDILKAVQQFWAEMASVQDADMCWGHWRPYVLIPFLIHSICLQ